MSFKKYANENISINEIITYLKSDSLDNQSLFLAIVLKQCVISNVVMRHAKNCRWLIQFNQSIWNPYTMSRIDPKLKIQNIKVKNVYNKNSTLCHFYQTAGKNIWNPRQLNFHPADIVKNSFIIIPLLGR